MKIGKDKRKTLVINVVTKEEKEFDSRLDASKATGLERKRVNAYMQQGIVYKKTFKFVDLHKGGA